MSDTVKLTVEASGGPTAKVIVDDFLQQTQSLLAALKETAKVLEGAKAQNIRYRIESLSTQSPLIAEYRGEMMDFASPVNFGHIHHTFEIGLDAIVANKDIPETVNASVLKFLRDFCIPIGGSITTNRLSINGTLIQLDAAFRNAIAKINAEDKTERGMFVKGMIEAANIHESNRFFFFLYPTRGPQRIRCVFPSDLREAVREAFGKFVRVHGDFKYAWREKYPYEVRVQRIESLPPRGDLPDIRTFFGAAPDATWDLNTEDFMEELRNG